MFLSLFSYLLPPLVLKTFHLSILFPFPPSFVVFCIRRAPLFFIYLILFPEQVVDHRASLHDGVVKRDSPSSLFLFIPAFDGFQFSVSRFRTSNVSPPPFRARPNRLLGGKSHRNRAPLWAARESQTISLRNRHCSALFPSPLYLSKRAFGFTRGTVLCAVSLQMEFRIKTYKGREGDDGRWKIGKNGRTRERERGRRGDRV